MTLDERLLEKLANWRAHTGRQTLSLTEEGWQVSLTADYCDQVGSRVWELAIRKEATTDDLRAWADHLAANVTGLLEPLTFLEHDAEQGVAFLRSQTPATRGDKVSYYEVQLRRGEATLRRYQASRTAGRREQAVFTLTHDALAKLVADFTADA